ncbi:Hypothetical predicted protein [Paramuricea clavata]|uniref:Uncharacterized protein n=1 Tax=Paramuricea clavata TaxID=317549 RepID=A0A7D9DL27_PARCT|nr:Hypothetical predicted protein [Paramuricea clavata]
MVFYILSDKNANKELVHPEFQDENPRRDLEAIIEECQDVVGQTENSPSAWQKRMTNLDENWQNVRETIFESAVCSFAPPSSSIPCCKCGTSEAMLRCCECGINRFLCVNCDDEVHLSLPFHNREVWFNGYFQHILPTETISEEKKIIHVGMCYYSI